MTLTALAQLANSQVIKGDKDREYERARRAALSQEASRCGEELLGVYAPSERLSVLSNPERTSNARYAVLLLGGSLVKNPRLIAAIGEGLSEAVGESVEVHSSAAMMGASIEDLPRQEGIAADRIKERFAGHGKRTERPQKVIAAFILAGEADGLTRAELPRVGSSLRPVVNHLTKATPDPIRPFIRPGGACTLVTVPRFTSIHNLDGPEIYHLGHPEVHGSSAPTRDRQLIALAGVERFKE